MLKIKPFDVPNRPVMASLHDPIRLYMLVVTVALCAAATQSWWSLLLVVYVLSVYFAFTVREWRWHRYADKCEASFVQIGESMDEIGDQIERIAVQVEARAAEDRIIADADPAAASVTWTGYWAAPSKGQH